MRRARIVRIEWEATVRNNDFRDILRDDEILESLMEAGYRVDLLITVSGDPSFEVKEEER